MHADLELVKAAQKGDEKAFRQIVDQHEQLVRSTVLGMVGDPSNSEDIAQEVFIRFYKSMHLFKGEAKLGTYLCRIAINLSLNEIKRQKRYNHRIAYISDPERSIQLEDQASNPEKLDTKDLVHKAIQELESEFKSVIVLRLIDGYSVKETAEILKLPMGTVASRLARGQQKLKAVLDLWKESVNTHK